MRIRKAVSADALAIAHVHVRSWQAAYQHILPAEYLDALRAEDRAAQYDLSCDDPRKPYTMVAELHGIIRAFATISPSPDGTSAECGELRALYVDPEYWGCGAGSALLSAAEDHLRSAGFRRAVLWVLTGNARAERFYRARGWSREDIHRQDTVWSITVEEDRFSRRLP